MPSVERDGAMLSYVEQGEGPAIILQHPLTADGRVWNHVGVAGDLVANGFRCISIDALGHGRSGPCWSSRAGLSHRVCDVLAVADALGASRFHYVGYSMGGWIGVGLIEAAPDRLLSASIAGWDPIDGARKFTEKADMPARYGEFLETIEALSARKPKAERPDEVTKRGFLDTFGHLFTDLPSITTLIGLSFPLMIAVGESDPYFDAARSAAEALDVRFLSLPGDHIQAFQSPEYRKGLVNWIIGQRGLSVPA